MSEYITGTISLNGTSNYVVNLEYSKEWYSHSPYKETETVFHDLQSAMEYAEKAQRNADGAIIRNLAAFQPYSQQYENGIATRKIQLDKAAWR